MPVELYQLKSLVTVAELGHLTRAAERLHLSQPAVSAQIKALEDELAVVLFERHASGMTLTAAGRQLLPEAEAILAAAQALRARASELRGAVGGRVRVGTVADPKFLRLPDVLRTAVERFPLLEIDVHQEVSGAAFAKVRDAELDAAFYYGELAHAAVASMPLLEFAYRVAAPAAWAKRLARADWSAIAAEPWIMTPAISTHRALAARLFAAHGAEPVRHVEADHEAVIASLVTAGVGVALMREDIAQALAASGEVFIWGDQRLTTWLQFIHRRDRERDPPVHALRDVVREVWLGGAAAPRRSRRARQASLRPKRRTATRVTAGGD